MLAVKVYKQAMFRNEPSVSSVHLQNYSYYCSTIDESSDVLFYSIRMENHK